jgi:regulator of sigma D
MDIRETVKKTLNESNLTNPSKLYTPFTLFAVYFAIYFKADILGRIFLSDDWAVTEAALADLKNPGLIEWFTFAGEVTAYSLLMLFLYGIAQAIAVSIWATSNRIHSSIASKLERGKFVASSLLDKAEQKIESLRSDNRKLYTELASYHTWKPEDINRLERLLEESNETKDRYLNKLNEAETSLKEIETIKSDLERYKIELDFCQKLSDFFIAFETYQQLFKEYKSISIDEIIRNKKISPGSIAHVMFKISNLKGKKSIKIDSNELNHEYAFVIAWCIKEKIIEVDHQSYIDDTENENSYYSIILFFKDNMEGYLNQLARELSGVDQAFKDLEGLFHPPMIQDLKD